MNKVVIRGIATIAEDADPCVLFIGMLDELKRLKIDQTFVRECNAIVERGFVVNGDRLNEVLDDMEFTIRAHSPEGWEFGFLAGKGYGYWERDKRIASLNS